MDVRAAVASDADEVVRLAAIMFESMGVATSGAWAEAGARQVTQRLGDDLAVFVVEHPEHTDTLIASAAGTVSRRLPGPFNPSGLAGYVQWVCVDPGYRRVGLARQVMTRPLGWYADRDVKTLELHATPMAEPLYREMGFAESGGRALRRRVD